MTWGDLLSLTLVKKQFNLVWKSRQERKKKEESELVFIFLDEMNFWIEVGKNENVLIYSDPLNLFVISLSFAVHQL